MRRSLVHPGPVVDLGDNHKASPFINPGEHYLQPTEQMGFVRSDDEPNPGGLDLAFTVRDFGW